MTLQLICLALIALLVIARFRSALARPEARLTWLASLTGTLVLTTYGFPRAASGLDRLLGGQNLVTLLRDASVVLAVWLFRQALTSYTRTARGARPPYRLVAVIVAMVTLFFLIGHRTPTTRTLVLDQIAQPAAWLYGCTYMAAVLWILLDSVRTIVRRGTSHRWMRLIAVGASCTAIGCAIEIAVFTTTHYRWGGSAPARLLPNAFQLPFFTGLAAMLTGIAAIALLAPARRRILIGRLHLLGARHHLVPARPTTLFAPLISDKHAAARTHRLLVLVGNAQRAGHFTPTRHEAALVQQAQQLLHADEHFHPTVLRDAA